MINLAGIYSGGVVPRDMLDEHIELVSRRETILPLKDIEKMKDTFKNLGKNSFDTINIVKPIMTERK